MVPESSPHMGDLSLRGGWGGKLGLCVLFLPTWMLLTWQVSKEEMLFYDFWNSSSKENIIFTICSPLHLYPEMIELKMLRKWISSRHMSLGKKWGYSFDSCQLLPFCSLPSSIIFFMKLLLISFIEG